MVNRLLRFDPRLWLSRSWTTRKRRAGEADDAYVFVDRASFERRVAEDGFLEHIEFLGNLYGTPYPEPQPGQDVVLEIDVQGARQVKERDPEALLIFMQAPSPEVQRDRLLGRGDSPELVDERVGRAPGELAQAEALGATMVVNDDLDSTVADVASIIDAERVPDEG